ncbi:hypothetical protein SLA2020_007220 [Shorea laevis]
MEDYNRSRSYGNGVMGMESYHPPPRQPTSYDLQCYSASYAQTQMGMANNHNPGSNNNDFELKKGKSTSGSSSSSTKSWSVSDPEFQRKKRIASYKMYSVEGKVKGSLRRSFRWLRDRYTQVVYGWW